MSAPDCRWQTVTCADCKRTYRCTPMDDYYGDTDGTDGVCTACLLARHNLTGVPVMTVIEDTSPSPETTSLVGKELCQGAAQTAPGVAHNPGEVVSE